MYVEDMAAQVQGRLSVRALEHLESEDFILAIVLQDYKKMYPLQSKISRMRIAINI